MKKFFVLISCFAAMLMFSKVSFAQSADEPQPELSIEALAADASNSLPTTPQVLPFGYPPIPSVGEYPAYGVPYSFPRAARQRRAARISPPQYQPYPLPAPGAVPAAPFVHAPQMVAPPMAMGQVPPLQETLGAVPGPVCPPVPPTVFYRPTPIRNFITMLSAPRPYIGYDPYVGYPPFPGYIPPL